MQEQVDERVSARFEKSMLEEIDTHVEKMGYSNRSEFLRAAARTLLDTRQFENAETVELPPLLGRFIDAMVDRGYYMSKKSALETAIDGYFTNQRRRDIAEAVSEMEIATGMKVKAELEKSVRKQIVKP